MMDKVVKIVILTIKNMFPYKLWDLTRRIFYVKSSLLSNGYWGSFPGVKRPERVADHSPQSTAEVKNGGSIPPVPHASPWRGAQLIN
jgi:hypothetical protein